jgi:hypothetical protein
MYQAFEPVDLQLQGDLFVGRNILVHRYAALRAFLVENYPRVRPWNMLGFALSMITRGLSNQTQVTGQTLARTLDRITKQISAADVYLTIVPSMPVQKARDPSEIAKYLATMGAFDPNLGLEADVNEITNLAFISSVQDGFVRRWSVDAAGSPVEATIVDFLLNGYLARSNHAPSVTDEARAIGEFFTVQSVITVLTRAQAISELFPSVSDPSTDVEQRRRVLQTLGLIFSGLSNVAIVAEYEYWRQLLLSPPLRRALDLTATVELIVNKLTAMEHVEGFDTFGVRERVNAVANLSLDHLGTKRPTIAWPEQAFMHMLNTYQRAASQSDEPRYGGSAPPLEWRENAWGYQLHNADDLGKALLPQFVGTVPIQTFDVSLYERVSIAFIETAVARLDELRSALLASTAAYFGRVVPDVQRKSVTEALRLIDLNLEPVMTSEPNYMPECATLTGREAPTPSIVAQFDTALVPTEVAASGGSYFSFMDLGNPCRVRVSQLRDAVFQEGSSWKEGVLPVFGCVQMDQAILDSTAADMVVRLPALLPSCYVHSIADAEGQYALDATGLSLAFNMPQREMHLMFGVRLGSAGSSMSRLSVAQQLSPIGVVVQKTVSGGSLSTLGTTLWNGLVRPTDQAAVMLAASHLLTPNAKWLYGVDMSTSLLNQTGHDIPKPARAFAQIATRSELMSRLIPLDMHDKERANFFLLPWHQLPMPPLIDSPAFSTAADYVSSVYPQVLVPRWASGTEPPFWMTVRSFATTSMSLAHQRLVALHALCWRSTGAVVLTRPFSADAVTPLHLYTQDVVLISDNLPFTSAATSSLLSSADLKTVSDLSGMTTTLLTAPSQTKTL